MPQALPRVLVAVAFFCACGKKSDPAKKDAGPSIPAVAPIALPPLGADHVTRFQFIYGEASKAFPACAAKVEAKDWAAARSLCESALQKDPWHLDTHRLLAAVLAKEGEPAAAVDHLATALAGDYYKYAPTLAADDLASFRATPHGAAVAQLAQQIGDEYARRVKGGLWLLGRRSRSQLPQKPGVQVCSTHAELYAYDRESKRYLRLTHTDHQVAAWVHAPQGNEIALVGFDKVEIGKGADVAPLIAHGWVEVYDSAEWKQVGKRVVLPSAREISIGYGAGDQLLVSTAPAAARWTLGDVTVSSVDRSTGKLTKVTDAPPVPRVVVNLDEGRLVRGVPGVEAAWSNDPPTTTRLKAGGATIAIPESGQATQSTVAVAPGGARLAFATAVDPCAKDAAPSLYVADTKNGALKHLLTARSRFATRWVDDHVLAYEDGDGAIRLWDATTGREAQRLDDKTGFALDVLSFTNVPLCKGEPAEAGSGSDELPPEEGAGPVTAPQ